MWIYPLNALGELVVAGLWAASIADQINSSNTLGPTVHIAFAVINLLVLGAMLASARFVRRIEAQAEPQPVAPSPRTSGQDCQVDNSWDPWDSDAD